MFTVSAAGEFVAATMLDLVERVSHLLLQDFQGGGLSVVYFRESGAATGAATVSAAPVS